MAEKLRKIEPKYGRDELVDFLVINVLPRLEPILVAKMEGRSVTVNFNLTYEPPSPEKLYSEVLSDEKAKSTPDKPPKKIVQPTEVGTEAHDQNLHLPLDQ